MKMYVLVICSLILLTYVDSSDIQIVRRSEWGARPAKRITNLRQNPPPFIVVHHSDGPTCPDLQSCKTRVKNIQDYHMNDKDWNDIAYNFLIGGDGTVFEGRGWGIHGSHVIKYNNKSIGVCLIGNFMNSKPSDAQLNALRQLIKYAQTKGYVQTNYQLIGHRQGSQTLCPGNKLYEEIKTWSNFDNKLPPL